MVNTFPKSFASKALVFYLISLTLVSVVFSKYAMGFQFMILGVLGVSGFFFGSYYLTQSWGRVSDRNFEKSLFSVALIVRVVWVIFSYNFYMQQTGKPFEWGSADAIGYHDEAVWLSKAGWKTAFLFWFGGNRSIADTGYPMYLTALYSVVGPNVVIARLLKACYSAFTCVLVCRLARRNFGQSVGRMAGVFCMLMPNLIIYCGLHLKETEMLLLTILFVERADYMIRSRNFNLVNLVGVGVLALALFFFRTVLGAVAILSVMVAVVLTSSRVINWSKKLLLCCIGVVFLYTMGGSSINSEVSQIWESRNINQERQRTEQTIRGNKWAKYATGTVMAPMSFVVPFATMVGMNGQEGQLLIHSGNFVKNCLGVFVLLAIFSLLFIDRDWREHVLLEAFVVGYLLVVSASAFANAERFHLPTLPLLLVFAAYGISKVNKKNLKFVNMWFFLVVVMEVAWAYFKIGSRGLL